jgi:hypothetical protein
MLLLLNIINSRDWNHKSTSAPKGVSPELGAARLGSKRPPENYPVREDVENDERGFNRVAAEKARHGSAG